MRSIALLCGCLLLAGCGGIKTTLTKDTPLCPDQEGGPPMAVVRISIDVEAKTVTPKTCYVHSDTEVGWYEEKGKPFDARFKLKSPEKWGKMKYGSKPVGSHQETGFKAKDVEARESFEYDVTSQGITLDPTVIIDP